MKRITLKGAVLLALILVPCIALSVASAKKTACGFVSEVEGKAFVESDGSWLGLEGMDAMFAGDKLKVDGKSSVAVTLCGAAKKIVVAGPAEFTIGANGLGFSRGRASGEKSVKAGFCRTMLASAVRYDRRQSGGGRIELGELAEENSAITLMSAGGEGRDSEIGLYTTKVNPVKPYFVWKNVGGAFVYRVRIMEEDTTLVNERKADNNYMRYPGDAPALKPGGTYRCSIDAFDKKDARIAFGRTTFEVMSGDEARVFNDTEKNLKAMTGEEPDNAEAFILLGKFYESYGLLPPAVKSYGAALKLQLENDALRERWKLLDGAVE